MDSIEDETVLVVAGVLRIFLVDPDALDKECAYSDEPDKDVEAVVPWVKEVRLG